MDRGDIKRYDAKYINKGIMFDRNERQRIIHVSNSVWFSSRLFQLLGIKGLVIVIVWLWTVVTTFRYNLWSQKVQLVQNFSSLQIESLPIQPGVHWLWTSYTTMMPRPTNCLINLFSQCSELLKHQAHQVLPHPSLYRKGNFNGNEERLSG